MLHIKHPNPRVRALAEEMPEEDLVARAEQQELREEDERALEEMCRFIRGPAVPSVGH